MKKIFITELNQNEIVNIAGGNCRCYCTYSTGGTRQLYMSSGNLADLERTSGEGVKLNDGVCGMDCQTKYSGSFSYIRHQCTPIINPLYSAMIFTATKLSHRRKSK